MHKQFALLVFVILLMMLPASAWPQQESQLTGIVRDASGALVAGAGVSAQNSGTGVAYKSTSNAAGIYSFPALPPGPYEVAAATTGFKKTVRPGVVLETGIVHTVDFTLQPGDIAETVIVHGGAPLLEAQDAAVGQFIERETVLNMPLDSRRAASLVRLSANVAYSGETGANVSPKFADAGGRSTDQNWFLDGGLAQNVQLSTPILVANPPSESLQEFTLQSSNYGAELGRSANGIVLMTTRAGDNRWRGAAYEFLRNQVMDARTFFAAARAPLRYNVFGGSLGGPIKKDRTFFFINYEGSRRNTGSTISYIVPRPQEIQGDFSARTDVKVLDPLTKQQFPNNTIPQGRLDPVAAKFAALYPTPNLATSLTKAAGTDYSVNVSDPTNFSVGVARLDHSFSDRDRVFVRYFDTNAAISTSSAFPNAFADARGNNQYGSEENVTASYIRTFSPAFLNELRYTFIDYTTGARAVGATSGINGSFGLQGVDPNGFPNITVTGYTMMGSKNQSHFDGPTIQNEFVDNATKVWGRHEIKFGFEYRYGRNVDNTQPALDGQLAFNTKATNEGLATLLLGLTTTAAIQTNNILTTRLDSYAAFAQDTFKVTPRLTVTAGLRYDLDTPVWEIHNQQNGFDATQINPVSHTPGVVTFAAVNGRSKYANDFFTTALGPRFSIAWRPSWGGLDRWVVRSGYGIFYNPVYGDAMQKALTLGFGQSLSLTSVDGGVTPVFLVKNGFPAVPAVTIGPGLGAVATGAPNTSVSFIPADEKPGYSQQWNLTLQRELFKDTLFEIVYLGNVGHHLAGPDESINQIPLVNGHGPAAQSQALRPFPQYSDVIMMSPPWGDSSYHAMTVKFQKRFTRGFNLLSSYTWSKFIDNVQAANELAAPADNGYTDIQLRSLNKALSGNDIRNRFILSGIYQLPFHFSNLFLKETLGGWGLGSVVELHSGQPYEVTEQTNTTNAFSDGQRPNVIGDPYLATSRPHGQLVSAYFNTAAYANPGTGNFGNASRAAGIGPGYADADVSLYKIWPIGERLNLKFRADAFNALNHPNFANPNGSQGNGAFGTISNTVGTARQIQLNLRLEF